MALDTNLESSNQEPTDPVAEPPNPPSRDPTRKDVSLRDFLSKMDDYAPIVRLQPFHILVIPSPLVSYILPYLSEHRAGLSWIMSKF